ncbi:hypothetical protein LTR64_002053 [Lithohypha guttulata]|uniref:uncharacterized protein n=1 Tax=Lithohypha guttulata TaxID=1690604 RepID=UPI002DE0A89D|nr:hypothetical protein LTR51_007911 [Lithohypha guttulata]
MSGDATIEEQFGFEMDLDLEEDVQAELEDFILLARLGVEDEALHLARTVLWHHVHHFPVFAEVAGFLLEHRLNDRLQELISEMNEKDIHFQLEEQQAFSLLIYELSSQTLDRIALFRRLIDVDYGIDLSRYREEVAASSHQPISPIEAHSAELRFRHGDLSMTPFVAIYRDIATHLERLIKYGLHWEAAQIFGLIVAQSGYDACPVIRAKYKELMLATDEAKLIADIQSDQADYEVGIEDTLATVSAKSTYAEHVMSCKACSQEGQDQVLKDSFTILLRWLFRRLPNTQPRGKLFDTQTRLGTFLLRNSVDQSQPTRYGSSRATGRGTELACRDSGTLLTPKPDITEDATEIHSTKNSLDVEKSSPQLEEMDDTIEQDFFERLSSPLGNWPLNSFYGSSDNSWPYYDVRFVPTQERHTPSPPARRGNQYDSTIVDDDSRVFVGNILANSYVEREHGYSGAATGVSARRSAYSNYKQRSTFFGRPPTPTGKSSE